MMKAATVCSVAFVLHCSSAHAATFGATTGSPPRAGIRGALAGPGYDNLGDAFCVLLIAQDPNPAIFIGTNTSSTLYDCTDLAELPLSDYSFATVQTKCLTAHSALILNSPATVPGLAGADGSSYCNYVSWDAHTLNLTFSSGPSANALQCPTAQVTPKTVTSTNNVVGLNIFYPLDGAEFPDCSNVTSS